MRHADRGVCFPGVRDPHPALRYSSAMASSDPNNAPVATPPAAGEGGPHRHARTTDRRLRVEDILKLMVADPLVTAAHADPLPPSPTPPFDPPLGLIPRPKWRSPRAPPPPTTPACLAGSAAPHPP